MNNTNARDQVTAISDSPAELTLYKNQRVTVLVEDIVNLSNTVNKLLNSSNKDIALSIADINKKLIDSNGTFEIEDDTVNIENLNLQKITIEELTPLNFAEHTIIKADSTDAEGYEYIGISEVTLSGIARAEDLIKDLTNSDLIDGKFIKDLSENNSKFGSQIEITPILSSLEHVQNFDIKSEDFNKEIQTADGIQTINYSYNTSETDTHNTQESTEQLGFDNVIINSNLNISHQIKLSELNNMTLLEAIKNKETSIVPEDPYIGIYNILLPEESADISFNSPTVLLDNFTDSATNITANPATNINSIIVTKSIKEPIISVQEAAADKLGFRKASATQNILTYKAELTETLPLIDYGTFEYTTTKNEDTGITTEEYIAKNSTIPNTDNWTLNSNDTTYALQTISIPRSAICQVTISEEEINNIMSNGGGVINLTGTTNNYLINQATISIPPADTYIDGPELIVFGTDNQTADSIINLNSLTQVSAITNINDNTVMYQYNYNANDIRIYWDIENLISNESYDIVLSQYNNLDDYIISTVTIKLTQDEDTTVQVAFNPKTGRLKFTTDASINFTYFEENQQQTLTASEYVCIATINPEKAPYFMLKLVKHTD